MAKDRPRYYAVKNGNAFWAPGKFAEPFGLPKSHPLGPDGPEAKKAAIDWTAKLDAARKAARGPAKPKPSPYPPGSLGRFYERFRGTEAWRIMERRTREDYERAWPVIAPLHADKLVTQITPDVSERLHTALHPKHNPAAALSWNEAHRALKVWRALLSAMVAYRVIPGPVPVGRVANPSPPGRAEVWLHDEILVLASAAAWGGFPGMAAAIRLAWDAMLAPVDVRTLPAAGWLPKGLEIHWERQKTGKAIYHAVTRETGDLLNAYLSLMPTPMPAAPIIRRPTGAAYRDKDSFGDDFRMIRNAVFPGDERQFLDIRRSAATEARLGGADKDDIGAAMANRIDENTGLEATYIVAASRKVLAARLAGRERMAVKFRNAAG